MGNFQNPNHLDYINESFVKPSGLKLVEYHHVKLEFGGIHNVVLSGKIESRTLEMIVNDAWDDDMDPMPAFINDRDTDTVFIFVPYGA